MLVSEEVLHTIRMNQVEMQAMMADVDSLIADAGVEIDLYPALSRFLAAVGWGASQGTEVVPEYTLTLEDE